MLLVLSALLCVPAMAQVAKQGNDVLSSLSFLHDKLRQGDESEPLDNARSVVDRTLQNSWDAFRIGVGPAAEWNATIDKRSGLVTFAEGQRGLDSGPRQPDDPPGPRRCSRESAKKSI